MKISVYGAGYVGLVSAACLAKLGHFVVCLDIDAQRIQSLLQGHCPFYEENLPQLLQEQAEKGHLQFTTTFDEACRQAEMHLIATGTPSLADGNADLSQIYAVAEKIAEETQKDSFIVVKSTVPVGTSDLLQAHVTKKCQKFHLEVCSNPEFLREGTAVKDFLTPDRIIIGGSNKALAMLQKIYEPLIERGVPLLTMSCVSAELVKYSANAMLACRISFMNQISSLAEKVNANIDEVKQGMSKDPRIGSLFLEAGLGYGGSCFPKDLRSLTETAKKYGVDASLFEVIDKVNQNQKNWVYSTVNRHFNHVIKGLTIGIWGLAFKPATDDMREASSLVAIHALEQAGAKLCVFDPIAMPRAQNLLANLASINWCDSLEAVLESPLDALVIVTEWPVFKQYPLDKLKVRLGQAPIFDGRNCFGLAQVEEVQLPYYYSVGRPPFIAKVKQC